jgi:hypothetical protein
MYKPKEKAWEIFNNMKGFRVKHSHAKKCAKVCARECLNIMQNEYGDDTEPVQFMKDVLAEIENIKTP